MSKKNYKKTYQKAWASSHKDRIKTYNQRYLQKFKRENPEGYNALLRSNRLYKAEKAKRTQREVGQRIEKDFLSLLEKIEFA